MENEDRKFFEGLAAGVFAMQRCEACGKHQFPPGPTCWRCGATDLEWRTLEGEIAGTVYTWTIVQRSFMDFKDLVPYTVVVADLVGIPEVRILARLFGAPKGEPVAIGARVNLRVTKDERDRPIYAWEYASRATS